MTGVAMTEPEENLRARLARIKRARTTILTHYGRKTGKPYRVKIWFTVDGDHINLMTMNMKRQWTRNVLQNPKVSLKVAGEVFEGEVAEVTDPGEMKRVVELMKRKYPISIPYLWIKKRPDGAFHVRVHR
jgi:deazaflavin-dependent oxidoreductase (nitroreductase family)